MNRTSSTSEALARLKALSTDGHRVLSVYVSLDPSAYPHIRDRHMQVDALMDEAERRYLGETHDSHDARMALREDLARTRKFFTDAELAPPSARGLAVFCCTPADVFEVVSLPRPVQPTVAVADGPLLEPLIEVTERERWCVALISRRTSRFLVGTRKRLSELAPVTDDVHGRHSKGGWSQANYQRSIEQDVDAHIKRTCQELLGLLHRRGFERLLIACPAELRQRVEDELDAELSGRLAGHLEIDVERATPAEALERATPVIEADERLREHEALERLREGLAPNGHAAAGLEEVLESLNERRVGTLLLAHGQAEPGFECPGCGRLSVTDAPCPIDGAAPIEREDILERAVELALDQSAEVLVVRYEPQELAEHGSVGALLRY